MNKRFFIIVIGLGIILLLIIVFVLSQQKPSIEPKTPASKNPARLPFIHQERRSKKTQTANTLRILNVIPEKDINKTYLPVTQVEFTFSDLVNPKTLDYEVTPTVKTYIKTEGNTLTIYPETIWQKGITTITILQSTKSASGSTLAKPFTYQINTDVPAALPEDIKDY